MSDIDAKELYKIAIDTRNFEINLFWQRSNYFLVLNTAIAIGTFSRVHPEFQLPFAMFGIVTSCLWFRVNLGSKYWQVRWEHKVAELEKIITKEILFSADRDTTDKAVENFLSHNKHQDSLPSIYENLILSKASVSRNMIYLSVAFVIFWAVVLLLLCCKYFLNL